MTASELIESLKHYPPDALVVIEGPDHSYRQVSDWPVIAVASKDRRRLSEDVPNEPDADIRKRGERRFAAVLLREYA